MEAAEPVWEARVLKQTLAPGEQERRERFLDTTRRIVDAGLDLVAETPDGTFTVLGVAQRAGISVYSFYRYFPSKDDLSLAIYEEAMRIGTEYFGQIASRGETPLERLRLTLVLSITPGIEFPRRLSPSYLSSEYLRLRHSHPREIEACLLTYRQFIAKAISDAQDAGEFSGIDPVADARMIQRLIIANYQVTAQGITGASDDEMWDFCLGALRRHSAAVKTRGSRKK
jgi:AcrR family transcriptional regulator